MYYVIYDGNCNLCVNLVRWLEAVDQGDRFQYTPMQDEHTLEKFGITSRDCEQGMIVINGDFPDQRWQGSDAAEEIGRQVPFGSTFVDLYRALPGMKWLGDRTYEQVRDNRYSWFGKRTKTYTSNFPSCQDESCSKYF
ncbi:MAG: DCC1-like thiol-disulfide oxidoreductase family protein [Cyanobacteria bacterium P01_E01_bin.6]